MKNFHAMIKIIAYKERCGSKKIMTRVRPDKIG